MAQMAYDSPPPPAPEATLSESSPFARVHNMAQLGQLLNTVRRSQRREIGQIASELRLKSPYLEALEEGDWDGLPGAVYARGYLKKYAEALGLSPQEAVLCCRKIQGELNAHLRYLEVETEQETPDKSILWLSLIAAVVLIGGWSLYQSTHSDDSAYSAATLAPPPAYQSGETFGGASSYYPAASCLNIPHKAVYPCYATRSEAPSLILTKSAVYPIWNR